VTSLVLNPRSHRFHTVGVGKLMSKCLNQSAFITKAFRYNYITRPTTMDLPVEELLQVCRCLSHALLAHHAANMWSSSCSLMRALMYGGLRWNT
jgi:hypothetical protein